MSLKKEKEQQSDRLRWNAPQIFILDIGFTEGKRRDRAFEGGNNPNNPCQPGSNNFNPNLNRCFRRGPS